MTTYFPHYYYEYLFQLHKNPKSISHFVAFLFLTQKKKVNHLLESRKIKEEYYQGDSNPRIFAQISTLRRAVNHARTTKVDTREPAEAVIRH